MSRFACLQLEAPPKEYPPPEYRWETDILRRREVTCPRGHGFRQPYMCINMAHLFLMARPVMDMRCPKCVEVEREAFFKRQRQMKGFGRRNSRKIEVV